MCDFILTNFSHQFSIGPGQPLEAAARDEREAVDAVKGHAHF
jgi:hypothetical protein